FCYSSYAPRRDLHSFPTRRSSDLVFAFTPEVKIVIGVDVGATHIGVALTDLAANILQEHREIANIARGPELILQRVGEIVHELRSEEHTSELQSRFDLVCRLLLEK